MVCIEMLTAAKILFLVFLTQVAFARPGNIQELIDLGRQTKQKVTNLTFSWKVLIGRDGEEGIEIATSQSPKLKHITFTIVKAGARHLIDELYIDEHFWYSLNTVYRPAKFRPYEANLLLPSYYGLLKCAELQFGDFSRLENAEIAEVTNGVVRVQVRSGPEYEHLKEQLQKAVAILEKDPSLLENRRTKLNYDDFKTILKNGIPFEFDAHTGLLTRFMTTAGNFVKVEELNWGANAPKLPAENWFDQSGVLKGVGGSAVMMMAHAPLPGTRDLDSYLLNIENNDYRRIPSVGGVAMGGCFFPDRKTVLVHESDLFNGGIRPHLVDIASGRDVPFLPEAFADVQFTSGGSISSDKSKLVLLVMTNVIEMTNKQIVVIDLREGHLQKLGAVGDYGTCSWLSNGEEILLERMEREESMDVPLRHSVCVMNSKGEVRRLVDGGQAIVLPRNLILYQRPDKKWRTIRANGRSEKSFAPNIPDLCGFPAVSPDGRYVIFVAFDKSEPKGRVLVDLKTRKTTFASPPPGVWTLPIW
jgi:hypothetical protein